MKAPIVTAIDTLLATDETVDPLQRDLALLVLRADPEKDKALIRDAHHIMCDEMPEHLPKASIKRRDVADLLGVHIRTVDYYVRCGLLEREPGSGKRQIGIKRESVFAFLRCSTPVRKRKERK